MGFFRSLGLVFARIFARRAADRVLEEVEDRVGLDDSEREELSEALDPFDEEGGE